MDKEAPPFLPPVKNNKIQPGFLAGIYFVSCATLCLELSLIRYFSINQQYHFAFWVVSIAFLGYAASGSFLSAWPKLSQVDHRKFLTLSSLFLALSVFFNFIICNSLPFDFIKLSWDKNQIFFVFLYYFLLSLPFFLAGLIISSAITHKHLLVTRIYFADLLGAGCGTLLSIIVFLPKGDRGVMASISFFALCASFLFCEKKKKWLKALIFLLAASVIALFLIAPSWLSFRISPFKDLPVALKYPQAKHLFTRWNAISRLDVFKSPAVRYAPGLSLIYDKQLPSQLGLAVDGGQLTAITHFSQTEAQKLEFLKFLPASFAYSLVSKPRTLIIEPRGGLDVLMAMFFKSSSIKVIESNPLLVKLIRQELNAFSGNLYNRRYVRSVSAISRSALQKEKNQYNLIIFSLTDVFGSSSTGLYGFGENYLFTLDSLQQALHSLSSQGVLSLSFYLLPPPRQELRILATLIEALERNGLNPFSRLIAIRSWGTISYFIKKTPFQKTDIKKLKDFADRCLFDLVYYPNIKASETNLYNKFNQPLYYKYTLQLLNPSSRKELYESYLFDIRPVSDDRPFFFNFFKWSRWKDTYQAFGRRWLPFLQGEFLVFLLLIQAIILAIIMIWLPLIVWRTQSLSVKSNFPKILGYFGLIGLAFMFVEITYIHKFILFLGHPLYAGAAIIFSLLFSSSLGSLFSPKILGENPKRKLRLSLCLCAVFILAELYFSPFFFKTFLGFSLPGKVVLTFFFVFPLGFLMGFPFPTGIRMIASREKRIIPWAWATNGFSSVVNSISALMIAFWTGYSLVLFLAAVAYLAAILFLGFSNHRDEADS